MRGSTLPGGGLKGLPVCLQVHLLQHGQRLDQPPGVAKIFQGNDGAIPLPAKKNVLVNGEFLQHALSRESEKAFQDVSRYTCVNTNTFGIDIQARREIFQEKDGAIPLPTKKTLSWRRLPSSSRS